MILQPFIENAIEHGLKRNIESKKIISVVYTLTNDKMIVTIEDNGMGIDSKKKN